MVSAKPWQPGYVVADRYRLDESIGSGGMGEVWRAEHVKLRSPVAIKLLLEEVTADEASSERFLREARAAAAIRSTNVVQVLDYGVEDGRAYIAMELLAGESLRRRLARQGRLSSEETADVLTGMGRAIRRAHKNGIVHRDLKPGNVHLVPEEDGEVVKVLDFGIAKVLPGEHADAPPETSTQTGHMLGTPFYMSPEQARGRAVDHRTDLWAMAVIAYQCLLGERPFKAETLGDLIVKICMDPVPVPSEVGDVPPDFDAWFARATARDPDERFQTARDLVAALRTALLDEATPASRRAFDQAFSRSSLPPDTQDDDLERSSLENTGLTQARTLGGSERAPAASNTRRAGLIGLGFAATLGIVGAVATMGDDTPAPAPARPSATTSAASVSTAPAEAVLMPTASSPEPATTAAPAATAPETIAPVPVAPRTVRPATPAPAPVDVRDKLPPADMGL